MINIVELLERQEGFRQFAYRDTVGKITVGIGRNLEDKGISKAEALYLLHNDINDCEQQLKDRFYWFEQIHEDARTILISLCFNMGLGGLLTFTKALEHFKNENYKMAADELMNSKWAKQVGTRSLEIADILNKL